MRRRVFTTSDFKTLCQVCGRNCGEEESSVAIPITFTWKYEGSTVYLCGSFSQWQIKLKMNRDSEDEPFKLEVSLPPGIYEYKFIVDGVWQYNPYEGVVEAGFDTFNNIIEITPPKYHDEELDEEGIEYVDLNQQNKVNTLPWKIMKLVYQFPAESVAVKGSWDGWKKKFPLKKSRNNFTGKEEFYVAIKISSGNYHFKFLVDNVWTTSPTYPLAKDSTDVQNNILVVPSRFKKPHLNHINWEQKGTLNWKREEGRWTECGRIHHTFQGHSMNVVCDMIYIFGGMANNVFTNILYTFDPRTNEFSLVDEPNGDIPSPRAFHHTSVFGTKIMVYGGFNETYLSDCYVFDTAINTWAKVNIDCNVELSSRERPTLAPYAGDKLVLFGGYYCSSDMEVEKYLDDTYVLNLSLTKWIKPMIQGELPQARSAHTANFIRNKMYVFGGVTRKQKNLNDVWMLKTSQTGPFEWKKIIPKGPDPEPRHGHSAVVSQNNIIYYGGRGNGSKKFYADFFVFDSIAEQWVYPKLDGVMPTPRYFHASVVLDKGSEVVIFGGIRPKEFLNYPRMYILEVEPKKTAKKMDKEEEKLDQDF
jgi:N-acetylneuraminic acid mutarotase